MLDDDDDGGEKQRSDMLVWLAVCRLPLTYNLIDPVERSTLPVVPVEPCVNSRYLPCEGAHETFVRTFARDIGERRTVHLRVVDGRTDRCLMDGRVWVWV